MSAELIESALIIFSDWFEKYKKSRNEKWGQIISRKDGTPYLRRWYLTGGGKQLYEGCYGNWSVFLHNFVNSDPKEEGLHDHPWKWAISLILCGGYTEVRLGLGDPYPCSTGHILRQQVEVRRFVKPWSFNFIRGTDFHRVELEEGKQCWSLFLHAKRLKEWGFLDPITHIYRKFTYGNEKIDSY